MVISYRNADLHACRISVVFIYGSNRRFSYEKVINIYSNVFFKLFPEIKQLEYDGYMTLVDQNTFLVS